MSTNAKWHIITTISFIVTAILALNYPLLGIMFLMIHSMLNYIHGRVTAEIPSTVTSLNQTKPDIDELLDVIEEYNKHDETQSVTKNPSKSNYDR